MKTWRLMAVLGLGTAGCFAAPTISGLGVAPAEAKAFYTRKRVNGTWVEGRFPKESTRRAVSSKRRGRTAVAAAPVAPAVPVPPRPERSETAAASPAASVSAERLSSLQSALQARAQAIAAAPADSGQSVPIARSVFFDFETGMKTTQFGGGVVVREPFDPATVRALASPAPADGAALSALQPAGQARRPRS